MRLLNILWRKRINVAIFVLAILSIIPAIPVIKNGTSGVFYNIDPEMALVGNALSYTQSHLISYRDHPGTPTILMLSTFFLPFRLYTKLVLNQNFISWSFDNISTLFLLVRYLMIGLSSISVAVYLVAIKKLTKNIWSVIFSGLALFSFGFTYRLGGAVLSEGLSFLIVSIWLLLFTYLLKNPKSQVVTIMSFLAGLAIANKYNNFPLLLLTLGAIFSYSKIPPLKRFHKIINNFLIGVIGFVAGTSPIIGTYKFIIKQMLNVFFQSGPQAAHGVGQKDIVNVSSFILGWKNLYITERFSFFLVVILTIVTLVVARRFLNRKIKNYKEFTIFVSCLVIIISLLFISKYPIPYYQFPNYLLVVFLSSFYVRKLKNFGLIVCLLLMPFLSKSFRVYNLSLNQSIGRSIYFENYVLENKTDNPTLWDFGYTQDFMLLWIRGWSAGVFNEEIKSKRPDLLELKPDNELVYTDYDTYDSVVNVCWDKLYIRNQMVDDFLSKHTEYQFNLETIGDTGMVKLTSNHCAKLYQ